jgi:hypothetical protein
MIIVSFIIINNESNLKLRALSFVLFDIECNVNWVCVKTFFCVLSMKKLINGIKWQCL